MIKQTVTYKDFTGEEQTDEFYFHLTEADVIELEVSANGNSLSAWTEKIVKSQNGGEIIATFKKIIAASYGVKSDDGRRFIKNPEILAEFISTNAYSKLFMSLATDAGVASTFVNGIMPEGSSDGKTATAAEAARKASEARMQGFNKTQPKPELTAERQPDLPVELQTAPPVLAASANATDAVPPLTPEAAQPDINGMSEAELRAYITNQGIK
jgi:hypothetical protein